MKHITLRGRVMIIRLCFIFLLTIPLVGCDKLTGAGKSISPPPPGYTVLGDDKDNRPHYQLHATTDGKIFRLDTRTGQTSSVTDKGLKTLPDDQSIQLRVGKIYKLESGMSAIYEGNEKLNSDARRIADALTDDKYIVTSRAEIEAEIARRKKDPLGIRK